MASRFGIYGGSFDPIHIGHVAAARVIRRLRRLDRVLVIPAAKAPHKPGEAAASFEDRVEMARRAVAGDPGLEVLDLEGRRDGPSYSVDTVAEVRRTWPDAALELLVGADMLADLPNWREADRLVAMVRVVGFGRPGTDAGAARKVFAARFGRNAHDWVEIPPVEAASTEIRRRLRAGDPVDHLLPPAVFTYIREKGLYRAANPG